MKKKILRSDEDKTHKARAGRNGVEGARSGRQTGKGSGNVADTLSQERIVELIDGARFASAKPGYQTQFREEYNSRIDAYVRRRLAEEAAAEKANEQRAQPRLESPPKSEGDGHQIS